MDAWAFGRHSPAIGEHKCTKNRAARSVQLRTWETARPFATAKLVSESRETWALRASTCGHAPRRTGAKGLRQSSTRAGLHSFGGANVEK